MATKLHKWPNAAPKWQPQLLMSNESSNSLKIHSQKLWKNSMVGRFENLFTWYYATYNIITN